MLRVRPPPAQKTLKSFTGTHPSRTVSRVERQLPK